MSLYMKVYSPSGRVFHLPPEKASDLVLNEGWSNTKPRKKPKTRQKKTPAPQEVNNGPQEVVNGTEEVELERED